MCLGGYKGSGWNYKIDTNCMIVKIRCIEALLLNGGLRLTNILILLPEYIIRGNAY